MGQTGRSVLALVLREMSTTYGRSPGGYLWAVLEPLAGIALLSIVLSMAFKVPPIGTSFPLYYATGLVPFLGYNDLASKVSQSINFSRPLLAYPSVTFVDALLARFAINYLIQLSVGHLVFFGIICLGVPEGWPDFAKVGQAFAMMGAFGFGVGTLNCFLLTRFPIWQRFWAILNRPLFVMSCIFFTFESIPPKFQTFLWWNPIVHFVGKMRDAFYDGYSPDYVSPGFVFGISMLLTTFGLVFLRRYHRDMIEA